jgi:hypothetical protein
VARQLVAAPAAQTAVKSAPFVLKASKTHVDVQATDRALGMRELLQVMKTDPNLHNCVIQQCGFDGDLFSATLRIEK